MRCAFFMAFVGVIVASFGCGARRIDPVESSRHVVVFVPGASGDGPWYGGAKRGIASAEPRIHVETFRWGAPLPLFALNFSNRRIHDGAERKLARRLGELSRAQPDRLINVVAHSAGCGVLLGALARVEDDGRVGTVVLLAPSVSPTYDLTPQLRGIRGTIHAFRSDRDTLFLSWRTSTFGTYDNVKTKAAGNIGFDLSSLPPGLRQRVVQHPYDASWKRLGHDGSHDGTLSRRFIERIVAPLIRNATPAEPSR